MDIEALRNGQLPSVLRPVHGDIAQPTLFLELCLAAGAQIRRITAVGRIQYEDTALFLALGRVHCRQDQIVLVEQRRVDLAARRIRRIERQFGQKRGPVCDPDTHPH